jgi:eukaryotic-like serine/threonine-protein kinase
VSSAGGDKLTTVGVAVGTPTYMSPEQATGAEHIDQRSDVYALGVLGYEMLTGSPPFTGKTSQAVLSAHVMEPAPEVTRGRPAVPPALADLVRRCLEKNPADRWQSAEEILHQLEVIATPSGGVTPTDTRPVRVASGTRVPGRNRRLFIGAAVAGVLAVAGFGAWRMLAGGSAPGPNRMAVLPLTDVSGQDAQLVEALHSQLIVALGQIPGIMVAPGSAVEIYKAAPKPAAEVAQELHVGAILEGNVFRAGQRLRITLQLTNPRTISQIWSQSFDLDLSGDLLNAIDGVIPQITAGVRKAVVGPATSS